jgi:hypothetical protein
MSKLSLNSFKWDRVKSYILLKDISFGRHCYKILHRAIKNQGEKKIVYQQQASLSQTPTT